MFLKYLPSLLGEVPRNTDEEAWKDANTMNLFFNVNYNSEAVTIGEQQGQEDTVNIASATLRLHRLPQVIYNYYEQCINLIIW